MQEMTLKHALMAVAAIAFAASAAAPALAANENPFAQDQTVLNLKGLDLSTADGQQRLAIRIDQAARAVCGERLAGVHLSLERKAQECQTAVVADVRAQIEARVAAANRASPTRLAALR